MSHQNLAFDSLHSFDNAQTSFVLSNPKAYNHYTGNLSPPYLSGDRSSYSSIGWVSSTPHLDDFNSSAQPRSANPPMLHCTQSSGYIDNSYPSHISSSPSYMPPQPQQTFTGFQDSHHSLGFSHRPGSDNIYSMLPPVLTEIPNHQSPNSAPASAGRGVVWHSLRTENPHQRAGIDIPLEPFDWSPLSADSHSIDLNSSWSDSLSSTSSSDAGAHCSYSLEVSSVAPPKPRSAAGSALHHHVSPILTSSLPPEPRRTSMDSPVPTVKSCSHCHATSTPLWRREPNTLKPLCNACGLYLSQRNKHRPQELIDADGVDDSDTSDGDGSGPECSHCHTHHTSVWRRSKTGAQLCNACGVYSRLRGKDRPLSLKRNKIKPRSKHTPPTPTTPLQ